jgi:HK97 family phage portal protein
VREPYGGAWQQNNELTQDSALAYHAVFSCITLIAADIGKLRVKLVEQQESGIWKEVTSSAFSPVLRKPNRYQNHIQFKEYWITSKLSRGNAYALKQRDNRGVVTALYLLDPTRVRPLVAPDGSVYYELKVDNLSGLREEVTVPASEIIHDRMNCLYHPLIGLSPIYASGLAATQGLKIQNNSSNFFGNNSQPGGILTAPGAITQATADRLKASWDANYTGSNVGKVAVLGDGLKFEAMGVNATDAQLIEQLRWTAEVVCSTFHLPAFKVGVGTMPTYQNGQILNQIYYSDCLQSLIESMELALDEGLGIGEGVKVEGRVLGVELDLSGLLRMDTATQIDVLVKSLDGGVLTTNEARSELDMEGVEGGDVIFRQQQDFPLSLLAGRSTPDAPAVAPALAPPDPAPEPDPEAEAAKMFMATHKAIQAAQLELAA